MVCGRQAGGVSRLSIFRVTGQDTGRSIVSSASSPAPGPQQPKEVIMKVNVGTLDRVLRIVAGLVLIALAATNTVGWWGWLGVIPLATGLFRFCPAYTLLGINTCPMKQ